MKQVTDTSSAAAPTANAGTAAQAEPARSRVKILLVDDQPARLLTYEAILSGLDVECVRANSGREALKLLLSQEFALILLDVNMPEMDGFETARMIREHPRWERTPIIFVTGVNVSNLDQLKGYEVGAIDYISVPVVPEILRTKVAVLVELHQRRRHLEALNTSLARAHTDLENRAKAALRHSDARHHALLDNAPVAVAHNSLDGRFEYVNHAFCKLVGYSAQELYGRRWQDITHPDDVAKDQQFADQVIAGELHDYTVEKRYIRKDGSIVWINLFGNFVADDKGQAVQGVSVVVDITEQHRAAAELNRSHERIKESEAHLREVNQRKDEFLAMLSHELRNPAAAIGNAAQALSRLVNREQERSLVGIVDRQIRHLGRLLDDLLDVSRITRGRIEINRERLTLQSCVELALETTQPLIQDKQHRLSLDLWPEPLWVNADKVRLAQCIANLLTNAAKYTASGGDIRVRAFTENNVATVEITDTGIGMPAELIPRVFELFVQGERALDRSQGGLGVGLAVCRMLIELQGGNVIGSSAGIGKGSTFTLRLPLASATVDANPAGITGNGSSARVLIVDDNRDAADSLALLLQLEDHATLAVYSGPDALTQAAAFEPQFVLLDIGLPEMDGYEVARRMKDIVPEAHLIAITGYGLAGDRQRSASSGFEAHLVKPVSLDDIQTVFASLTR